MLVTRLSSLTTVEQIQRFFSTHGRISECLLEVDPANGASLGISWIKFSDPPKSAKRTAHEVAKDVCRKCAGARAPTLPTAGPEGITVVLDPQGDFTKAAVKAELDHRRSNSVPKPKQEALPTPLPTPTAMTPRDRPSPRLGPTSAFPSHLPRGSTASSPPAKISTSTHMPPAAFSVRSEANRPLTHAEQASIQYRQAHLSTGPASLPPRPAPPSSAYGVDVGSSGTHPSMTNGYFHGRFDGPSAGSVDGASSRPRRPSESYAYPPSGSYREHDRDNGYHAPEDRARYRSREDGSFDQRDDPPRAKATHKVELQSHAETLRRLGENHKPSIFIPVNVLPVGKAIQPHDVRDHFRKPPARDVSALVLCLHSRQSDLLTRPLSITLFLLAGDDGRRRVVRHV